jgi:serine/threonine-protein kinase
MPSVSSVSGPSAGAAAPAAPTYGPSKPPSNLRAYQLIRTLGVGGMGSVWIAEKTATHQQFAIKFLREEFLQDATHLARFEREIAALRAIRHPNVVNIFDWSVEYGGEAKPYVVMELLDGEGLDQLLRRERMLQPRLAVAIMLQVLDGLAAAHGIGVIHRDLGPSNIFLTRKPDGSHLVRLLDFGLARPAIQGEAEVDVTRIGTLMGKAAYVAPEMFDERPLDARADIFACGVILFRMLAGRLPYQAKQGQTLWIERFAERTHRQEYPSVRDFAEWVPERLAMTVARAIRRKPEERFQTAQEMQADLLEVEDSALGRVAALARPAALRTEEVTPSAGGAVPEASVHVPRRRTPWAAFAAGALAVLVVAGIVLFELFGGSRTYHGDVSSAPPATVATAGSDAGVVADAPAQNVKPAPGPAEDAPAAGLSDVSAATPLAAADAAPEATAAAVDAAPPGPAYATLWILGAPAGSTIRIGDVSAEGDPPSLRVARSPEPKLLTIEASGYEPFAEWVVADADRSVQVTLKAYGRRGTGSRPSRGGADAGTTPGATPGGQEQLPTFPEDAF